MWVLCYYDFDTICIRFFKKKLYALNYINLCDIKSYYLSNHFEISHYLINE